MRHFKAHCLKSSFFVQKSTLISREKFSNCFGWKTRENATVLDFLAVDNFDFTRKIVKKIWEKYSWKCWGFALFSCWQLWFPEKIVKFCQNWIFGQKFDFSNSVNLSQNYIDRIRIFGAKIQIFSVTKIAIKLGHPVHNKGLYVH